MGDVVAEWLARWISRSRHLCLRRGWVNVLCSWAKHFTLTVPLSLPPPPQEYECVPANCQRRLTKYWLGGLGGLGRGGSDNMPP